MATSTGFLRSEGENIYPIMQEFSTPMHTGHICSLKLPKGCNVVTPIRPPSHTHLFLFVPVSSEKSETNQKQIY